MHQEDFDPKTEERITNREESDWMNVYLLKYKSILVRSKKLKWNFFIHDLSPGL